MNLNLLRIFLLTLVELTAATGVSLDELKSEHVVGSGSSGSSGDDYEYSAHEKSIWRKLNECKSDYNCAGLNSICLNGSCVRVCNQQWTDDNDVRLDEKYKQEHQHQSALGDQEADSSSKCVYFHCDSKRVMTSQAANEKQTASFHIETNNYPLLNRYLSRKKCSWLLTTTTNDTNATTTSSFVQLKFERFSTQLANDYLYIFAGDSPYSPMIAALRYFLLLNLRIWLVVVFKKKFFQITNLFNF
jgi:hypothetical protein